MSKRCFVVNEWLLNDLLGDNGKIAGEESFRFLKKLRKKCDRIVVQQGSPWSEKAYRLMTRQDQVTKIYSKYLRLTILQDSNKCIWLDEVTQTSLSGDTINKLPSEDHYLVCAYVNSDAELLITSDRKLYNAINAHASNQINVVLRDEFLEEYLTP